ncbi:hypothetical protein ACIQ1D_22970 [Lysinibacillus xylanilyticus]|uniref:hypothetical protein n=1 Tax=Lysinibacillus xylanilyticus TaxID=582475 RepID=UPI0037F7B79A
MKSEESREEFIGVLKKEFPLIGVRDTTLKSGNIRISPHVPNNKKNKRWMQIDANSEYLSIAMDHSFNDIKLVDINNLNLLYG